ncbi:hypothetical protein Tco_0507195, partial [Tanacetum coccineum]
LFAGDIFRTVSTVVCSGTAGEFSVAGIAGTTTVVGVQGPSRMHFHKAPPFGLVSMYRKNRDIVLLQALVDDPLNQLPLCCYAFDCRWKKLQLELS